MMLMISTSCEVSGVVEMNAEHKLRGRDLAMMGSGWFDRVDLGQS